MPCSPRCDCSCDAISRRRRRWLFRARCRAGRCGRAGRCCRAGRARPRRSPVEAQLHDDDEREHTALHGQAPPCSSSAEDATTAQAVLAHADRAIHARPRRCLVEAELHDDDERKHMTLHGQAPPFSSSGQAAVASSIDARAGRNARTSPAGAVRGDLDCDDIQERAVHGGQEATMQLGEKKMATFIRWRHLHCVK